MKLFKMDALHYALLAVLVLLVLYCATGVLREAGSMHRVRGLPRVHHSHGDLEGKKKSDILGYGALSGLARRNVSHISEMSDISQK